MTPKEKKAFVARMKKGRKAAKKNGGGKKNNSKRKSLEKRIAELENKLDNTLSFRDKAHEQETTRDETEYHKLKKERRELDAGDW